MKKFIHRSHLTYAALMLVFVICVGVAVMLGITKQHLAVWKGVCAMGLTVWLSWLFCTYTNTFGLYIDGTEMTFKGFISRKIRYEEIAGIYITKEVMDDRGREVELKDDAGNNLYVMLFLKRVTDDMLSMYKSDELFYTAHRKDILCYSVYDQSVIDYLRVLNPGILVFRPKDCVLPEQPPEPMEMKKFVKQSHLPYTALVAMLALIIMIAPVASMISGVFSIPQGIFAICVIAGISVQFARYINTFGIYIDGEKIIYKSFFKRVIDPDRIAGIYITKAIEKMAYAPDCVIEDQNGNPCYSMVFLKKVTDRMMRSGLGDVNFRDFHMRHVLCYSVYDQSVIDYLRTRNPDMIVFRLKGCVLPEQPPEPMAVTPPAGPRPVRKPRIEHQEQKNRYHFINCAPLAMEPLFYYSTGGFRIPASGSLFAVWVLYGMIFMPLVLVHLNRSCVAGGMVSKRKSMICMASVELIHIALFLVIHRLAAGTFLGGVPVWPLLLMPAAAAVIIWGGMGFWEKKGIFDVK